MKKTSWFQNMLWLCFCISMLVASFAVSNMLMLLIYRFTEKPPEPWGYFIYGVINLLLIFGIIGAGAIIKNLQNQPSFQRAILEAFEKIAQGNFDVFLEQDERGHFNIITDSINKMAKDLDSMEQLRQDFISNISHEFQAHSRK